MCRLDPRNNWMGEEKGVFRMPECSACSDSFDFRADRPSWLWFSRSPTSLLASDVIRTPLTFLVSEGSSTAVYSGRWVSRVLLRSLVPRDQLYRKINKGFG